MTLLADLVSVSKAVTETPARSRKVAILSELLKRLEADEVPIAVGYLTVLRQGRVGVGYSTIYSIEVVAPAEEPSVTLGELDDVIDRVLVATGSGSSARRRELLEVLLRRATEDEADFVKRPSRADCGRGPSPAS